MNKCSRNYISINLKYNIKSYHCLQNINLTETEQSHFNIVIYYIVNVKQLQQNV